MPPQLSLPAQRVTSDFVVPKRLEVTQHTGPAPHPTLARNVSPRPDHVTRLTRQPVRRTYISTFELQQ
jgi:hypothetical protein